MMALTFSLYVARRFLMAALAMLGGLTVLSCLFDFIELLRRASTKPDVTFAMVSQIAGLRVPFMAMQILPFAMLLGGMVAFWRLTRSSELIVARAAGISAWGFLAAPILVAFGFGLFGTMAVSPLSSAMLARAERLDYAYLRNSTGVTTLAGGQLWLRQADQGLEPRGVAILTGTPPLLRKSRAGEFSLSGVTVWRLSADDRPLARIEAPEARLARGHWLLSDAVVFGQTDLASARQNIDLPTDLTPDRIEDSFAPPDTLSFWTLPGFIRVLERAGFPAERHRLHFQSLLALPLLSAVMAMLAAGFAMRQTRRGGVAQMLGAGVAAGFALFVLDKVASEFGEAGTLPVILAAWAPVMAGLLLAIALLLHLEDG